MVNPIRPEQIINEKAKHIPDAVISIWNDEIAKAWRGSSAEVIQKDIVGRIAATLGISRQEVCDKGYVDIEDMFRAAGWRVRYDKPDYTESYDAYFTFQKKGSR
jgi:hypothetical protein